VPTGVENEYREAELCASFSAWRAASDLLRSTLEKVLRANGYDPAKSLHKRIDEAAADGIITVAHQKRAHANVQFLGNDVLHDEWREVAPQEYSDAHQYVQWLIHDFYDSRPEVEELLIKAKRLDQVGKPL
jgi:hypothetical protein